MFGLNLYLASIVLHLFLGDFPNVQCMIMINELIKTYSMVIDLSLKLALITM